jgi:hypothetical protein
VRLAVLVTGSVWSGTWSRDGPLVVGEKLTSSTVRPATIILRPHSARAIVAKRSPDEVLQALTTGPMRAQAAGLNLNERTWLGLSSPARPHGRTYSRPEAKSAQRATRRST